MPALPTEALVPARRLVEAVDGSVNTATLPSVAWLALGTLQGLLVSPTGYLRNPSELLSVV
ncbi:hypothetical protein DXG03_007376, partial [Asterophora parasitica]